jgi:hypothetical protein
MENSLIARIEREASNASTSKANFVSFVKRMKTFAKDNLGLFNTRELQEQYGKEWESLDLYGTSILDESQQNHSECNLQLEWKQKYQGDVKYLLDEFLLLIRSRICCTLEDIEQAGFVVSASLYRLGRFVDEMEAFAEHTPAFFGTESLLEDYNRLWGNLDTIYVIALNHRSKSRHSKEFDYIWRQEYEEDTAACVEELLCFIRKQV